MMIAPQSLELDRKAEPQGGLAATSGGPVTAAAVAATGSGATGAGTAGSAP
jgi:hypothetical protein